MERLPQQKAMSGSGLYKHCRMIAQHPLVSCCTGCVYSIRTHLVFPASISSTCVTYRLSARCQSITHGHYEATRPRLSTSSTLAKGAALATLILRRMESFFLVDRCVATLCVMLLCTPYSVRIPRKSLQTAGHLCVLRTCLIRTPYCFEERRPVGGLCGEERLSGRLDRVSYII